MIKIQNNTPIREQLPRFLVGLEPESLADLLWTDPALGVSDVAWWPEEDQSPELGQFEKYDGETLTIDAANKKVLVARIVVPWSKEEIKDATLTKADQMRAKRNAELGSTDWTQGKDIADDVSTAWATYRQALRDVPAQAGFPWSVNWPTQPE